MATQPLTARGLSAPGVAPSGPRPAILLDNSASKGINPCHFFVPVDVCLAPQAPCVTRTDRG